MAGVIQSKEEGEDLAAGGITEGETEALAGFVETVAEVGPAVGGGNGYLHLDFEVAKVAISIDGGWDSEGSCR